MTEPNTQREESTFDEFEQIVARVLQDRARLTQALQAERTASSELQKRLDLMVTERSQASQRAIRDEAQIDRLKIAAGEMERRYEEVLHDRDLQAGQLQAKEDRIGVEWAARFKRLAEAHEREIGALNQELSAARSEIETLQIELSVEKARTVQGVPSADLSKRAGTTFVVDGDPLAVMIWPALKVAESRARLVETLDEYGRAHRVRFDVIFRRVPQPWPADYSQDTVRVRVPHEGIPIEPVLRRLQAVHGAQGSVVLATNRPGFNNTVTLVRFATQIGHRPAPTRPALEAQTDVEMLTPQNVITIDRS